MIALAVHLLTLARAQSGPADIEDALVIPLHPSTPTTVQLRDAIVDAWMQHRGEFLMEIVGQNINLRPRPDTPAGTEAVVVVETSTVRRRFRVRVVDRPEDAILKIVLPAVKTAERTGEARPEVPPSIPPVAPAEPAASAPPRYTLPDAGHASAPGRTEPATRRGEAAERSPRFDLSMHALVTLAGVTALAVPGYQPDKGRRLHHAFGLRIAVVPRNTWWSVEAGISGERLAAPTVHVRALRDLEEEHRVSGTWLRADVGMRAHAGTRWRPTAYVGLGLQAHLRKTEKFAIMDEQRQRFESLEDMTYGAVLTLGMGLQYQARDVLMGIDSQMRQGVPADYRSVAVLLSVGFFLDEENEP